MPGYLSVLMNLRLQYLGAGWHNPQKGQSEKGRVNQCIPAAKVAFSSLFLLVQQDITVNACVAFKCMAARNTIQLRIQSTSPN